MNDEESKIRESLQALASEAFPDNQVAWRIEALRRKDAFYCVEARPEPDEVGYPRLRFIVGLGATGSPLDFGCYCLDQGRWLLLYTTPDTSTAWKTMGFDS